jgi:hypothetical protein
MLGASRDLTALARGCGRGRSDRQLFFSRCVNQAFTLILSLYPCHPEYPVLSNACTKSEHDRCKILITHQRKTYEETPGF